MRLPTLLFLLLTIELTAQTLPEIFEPGVVSHNGEFGLTLSSNGEEAFWVQSNGGRDTLIIMESQKIKGVWQTPKPASFSTNINWKDIDPMFSPDGNRLLFQSTRPVESKPERQGFDIWAVNRTKKGWSSPYHLGNVINSDASESFASITKNGTIYFMKANPNGTGSSDIYFSELKNGDYLEPVNLGGAINTRFRESNPYISPDEDYLIYFSDDSTGLGDVDLFISYKVANTWSKPINLGAPINSSIGEFCPFYHRKQKRLFFSRTQQNKNGRRVENIFSYSINIEKRTKQ